MCGEPWLWAGGRLGFVREEMCISTLVGRRAAESNQEEVFETLSIGQNLSHGWESPCSKVWARGLAAGGERSPLAVRLWYRFLGWRSMLTTAARHLPAMEIVRGLPVVESIAVH